MKIIGSCSPRLNMNQSTDLCPFEKNKHYDGISPPAAGLCKKPTGVLVSPDKIDKVVQHSDALVGHSGCVSCSESPPLPPAWVEHLKQAVVVCVRGEHPPKAQDTVEGGPRLGERTLQDGLPDLLLMVTQGSRNKIL